MTGGTDLDGETIGGLFSRLVEDGGQLVRAEISLRIEYLRERFREIRTGLILGAVALLLVLSSLTGLLVGCVIGLARFVGPVAAGLAVTVATLVIAGIFGWLAVRQFSGAGTASGAKK